MARHGCVIYGGGVDIQLEMQQMYADLFEAAAVSRHQGEELAGSVGQTQARWQTMWVIDSGLLTVPQVARRLGVSRQNVQRIADELRDERLLRLVDNPDHKTSPLLELTATGRAHLARINTAADEVHERMLAYISEPEIKTLRTMLRKLVLAIRATGPDANQLSR
jgi:DNA-binding MarR family transcriptional regulator